MCGCARASVGIKKAAIVPVRSLTWPPVDWRHLEQRSKCMCGAVFNPYSTQAAKQTQKHTGQGSDWLL